MADGEKKKRAPQGPKPVFVIMQLLGDDGNPIQIDKERVNVIVGTRNAGAALEAMEGYENAFYKAVMVEGR